MTDGGGDAKRYVKGGLVVLWQPAKCIHSARCARGLPGVFSPKRRPWIDLDQAEREAIEAQVRACPSGALSLGVPDGDD